MIKKECIKIEEKASFKKRTDGYCEKKLEQTFSEVWSAKQYFS